MRIIVRLIIYLDELSTCLLERHGSVVICQIDIKWYA